MPKTPQDRKEQSQAIVLDLQRSGAPEVKLFLKLIDIMFEDTKDMMVNSTGEATARYQGEARALRMIYKTLTTAPVITKPKE